MKELILTGVLLFASISFSQKALANRENLPMSVYYSVEVDPFITYEEIKERINRVATQLALDYEEQEIVVVMIMKGALCLAVDLIRAISFLCTIEYMQTSSYGMKGECRGGLEIKGVEAVKMCFLSMTFLTLAIHSLKYIKRLLKKTKIFKITSFGF